MKKKIIISLKKRSTFLSALQFNANKVFFQLLAAIGYKISKSGTECANIFECIKILKNYANLRKKFPKKFFLLYYSFATF